MCDASRSYDYQPTKGFLSLTQWNKSTKKPAEKKTKNTEKQQPQVTKETFWVQQAGLFVSWGQAFKPVHALGGRALS